MEKIRWLNIIRCVGILLVVIYHFFKEFLPGGFIGVDVFLTLSGFLLTAQVVEKFRANDGFEFVGFVKRRFVRIFPPLFMMIVFSLPLALLISPDFTADISRQAAAALSFVTNYYEIINGGSYEAQLLPHLFVHTWFLAVEVHILIIWGLILAAIAGLMKKRRIDGRRVVLILSATFAALSFVNMQTLYNAHNMNPSVAYFGTTSRAFPFFIGAMTGAITGMNVKDGLKKRIATRFLRSLIIAASIAAVVGLAVISSNVDFSGAAAYRYGMLAASLLTVGLILLLRLAHAFTPEHINEPKALSISGDMSYGVYLFHWPLYIVFANLSFAPGNAAAAGAAFAVSLCLSAIVTYWAQPVLQNRKRTSAKAVLAIAMICFMVLSGFTFMRAPTISSLELNMYISYLRQDSDMLYDFGFMRESVNAGHYNMPAADETHSEPDASMSIASPQEPDRGMVSPEIPAPAEITQSPPTTPSEPTESPPATTAGPELPPPSTPTESTQPPTAMPTEPAQLPPATTAEPEPPPTTTPSEPAQSSPPIPPEPELPPTPTPVEPVAPSSPPEPMSSSAINGGVTVVGCSVLLGARSALRDAIPGSVVNAEGSRQMWQGYEYIMRLQEAGTLSEYVVIALGTNVNENAFDYIEKIIADIAPGHRLIFVTPYNGQAGERSISYRTAVYIRTLPERYDFVTVADWSAAIMPNPHAIGADKIHIGGIAAGIEIFVNCVIEALHVAGTRPAKQ